MLRPALLETVQCGRPFTLKDPKASHSRLFSVQHAVAAWECYDGTKCLGLLALARQKGWFSTLSDVFRDERRGSPAPAPTPSPGTAPPPTSAAPAAASSGAASSSSSKPSSKEPAFTKTSELAKGKQSVEAARRASHNTLHAVLRVLASEKDLCDVRLVLLATAPVTASHHNDSSGVKDIPSTLRYYSAQANFEFMHEIRMTVGTLSDMQGQARSGMQATFPLSLRKRLALEAAEVVENDRRAETLWRLVTMLCAQRVVSMS